MGVVIRFCEVCVCWWVKWVSVWLWVECLVVGEPKGRWIVHWLCKVWLCVRVNGGICEGSVLVYGVLWMCCVFYWFMVGAVWILWLVVFESCECLVRCVSESVWIECRDGESSVVSVWCMNISVASCVVAVCLWGIWVLTSAISHNWRSRFKRSKFNGRYWSSKTKFKMKKWYFFKVKNNYTTLQQSYTIFWAYLHIVTCMFSNCEK